MSTRTFAVRRPRAAEQRHTFSCFGGECTVIVADATWPADAAAAAAAGERALLTWHERFSRFSDGSELSRLNDSPADEVVVSPLMRRIVAAGLRAARDTGGLVDVTLADEIERAGYGCHMDGPGTDLSAALGQAPERATAAPHLDERWRQIAVVDRRGTIARPPGLRIDVGGIAKGVFADELAARLAGLAAVVVECAGDLRLGGMEAPVREVHVASPFDDAILHTFRQRTGGVATSGIGTAVAGTPVTAILTRSLPGVLAASEPALGSDNPIAPTLRPSRIGRK